MRLLWNDITWYTIIHGLAGILTVLSASINPIISLITFCGFLTYELNEDWHLSDEAYKDILEYDVGMFITILMMVII